MRERPDHPSDADLTVRQLTYAERPDAVEKNSHLSFSPILLMDYPLSF
jgi:hypothetical protein